MKAIQVELRQNYNRIVNLIHEMPGWPSDVEIAGAIAVIVHTAYHLGEIRQALCTLKPKSRSILNLDILALN